MSAARGLIARSQEVDGLIQLHWPRLSAAALIAVGGYGRSELFPYSDIDLLIASERDDLRPQLGPFLQALWDSGLRVSQSVHRPDELADIDERNIELSVSLLDRRFLNGDRALYEALHDPPRDRLSPHLVRLTRERHAKYGETIYHLEPNVKEAPGTLRDLQVLRWLARLDGKTAPVLAHDLLFRLRIALHGIARRDQNLLNYAMQDETARLLGFESPEALMRAYYREAAPLYRACLRRLDQSEERRSGLLAAVRDRASRLSTSEFSVIRGQVYFRAQPVDSRILVRLFEFVARHGLPLANDAEDRARLIEPVSISWAELRAICALPHAAMAIRTMHRTGFLTQIFPALRGIESMVIRDFYHRYTVDEHTMLAIETAESVRNRDDRFGEIARETPDYPLLLVALLFHDAGKGAASDNHAEASVQIARSALDAMHVSAREAEIILFLIERHLDMSRLMLTRDLTDPGTAALLARTVQTIERLKLLTVLTFCDISAVNPEALTPWRATLLWQLYAITARHLTRSLGTEVAAEGMPARYGLTHSPAEIAEHHRMEEEGRTTRLDVVEGAYQLTVVSPDQPALFARIAGALASFGMDILRAEAFTNERKVAVEIFSFADPMRTLELNPSELDRLQKLIGEAISGRRKPEDLLRSRPTPRGRGLGRWQPRVSFDNAASARATLFEIVAEDRPGLLFGLAASFAAAGCNIEVVLIDTEGHKAIDVFYVTYMGASLADGMARALTAALTEAAA